MSLKSFLRSLSSHPDEKHRHCALFLGGLFALLLLAATLCLLLRPTSYPPISSAAAKGDYVRLVVTDVFDYFAYDGQDKWVLAYTSEGTFLILRVTNETYNTHLLPMTADPAPPVSFAGEITEPHPDVIRFGADAAAMTETEFSALVGGLCVDTTCHPPMVRAALGLLCAAAAVLPFFILYARKSRASKSI